jgi:tetratricopeptide (TPR) repeat protein
LDEWDWPAAETEFHSAIALNPNSADAHQILGSFLDFMGRTGESWAEFQRAQELDPNKDHLSATLETRGQYDRAIELLVRTIQSYPDNGYAHYWLSRTYAENGMRKQSVSELEQATSLFGMTAVATDLHYAFAKSGYNGAMRQFAKDLEYLHATQQIFLPRIVADIYADLGNKDRAFYWLEQAYQHRDVVGVSGGLVELKIDHRLDSLRSDSRFSDLLRRVGLPQ